MLRSLTYRPKAGSLRVSLVQRAGRSSGIRDGVAADTGEQKRLGQHVDGQLATPADKLRRGRQHSVFSRSTNGAQKLPVAWTTPLNR